MTASVTILYRHTFQCVLCLTDEIFSSGFLENVYTTLSSLYTTLSSLFICIYFTFILSDQTAYMVLCYLPTVNITLSQAIGPTINPSTMDQVIIQSPNIKLGGYMQWDKIHVCPKPHYHIWDCVCVSQTENLTKTRCAH